MLYRHKRAASISRHSCKALALAVAIAACLPAYAVAAEAETSSETIVNFNIPAGDLGTALEKFSTQSGVQVLYRQELVAGKRARAVIGGFASSAALAQLLEGTGIGLERANDRTFVLKALPPRTQQTGQREGQPTLSGRGKEDADPVELQKVIVTATGSNLRNIPQKFSPITSVTREQLDQQGFPTIVEYIQQLPQNFGGTVSPDRAGTGGSGAGGAAINLRNTGSEASLVLLNGRRIAPSGTTGNFVDLSSISGAALDRVEVLTDGASAVYGSDAIAGVVNIILDRDYVGSQSRFQYGSKDGDAESYSVGHTLGLSSARTHALIAVDYSRENPLHARDRRFATGLGGVAYLLPETEKRSALLTGGFNVNERLELFADLTYSDRQASHITNSGLLMENITDVTSTSAAIGLVQDFGVEWMAEASLFQSENRFDGRTAYGYLSPDAMSMLFRSRDAIRGAEAKFEGPLLTTAAGQARAVFGAQYREEKHDGYQAYYLPGGMIDGKQFDGVNSRHVQALYSEIYFPLIGDGNATALAQSLDLSLAARYERYSDFGSTFNPKFGLAWSPAPGVTLRGTWGTSYRAPRLQQMVDHITGFWIVDYADSEAPGGSTAAGYALGTEPTLQPEESTSWTVGIDLVPAGIPNLSTRLTWFDIDYGSRIAEPHALIDPETFTFHSYNGEIIRDPAAIMSYHDRADSFFNYTTYFPTGSQSSLADVTMLLRGIAMNTAKSRRTGLDLAVKYAIPLDASQLQVTLDAAYIDKAYDQFATGVGGSRVVGRVGQPARVKGNVGLSWAGSAATWGISSNYVSSMVDDRSLGASTRVGAWLTWNAFFGYRFDSGRWSGLLEGASVNVAVRNLLDRDPPRLAAVAVGSASVQYDSANADPDGRSLLLTFTKKW